MNMYHKTNLQIPICFILSYYMKYSLITHYPVKLEINIKIAKKLSVNLLLIIVIYCASPITSWAKHFSCSILFPLTSVMLPLYPF